MQVNKKKLIILVVGLVLVIFILCIGNKKTESVKYYYKFEYDDNLISQSLKVYDNAGKIQSNYNIYYNDKLVTLTKADKAVLTIKKIDLKDHQVLEMAFREDTTKRYKVYFKE